MEGGPLPPSAVGGVVLDLSYYEQITLQPLDNNTLLSISCVLVNASSAAVANGYGQFNGTISAPANLCNSQNCTTYQVTYGPVTVTPEVVPAGYGLQSSANGLDFRLSWVAGLASLALTPKGPTVPFAPGSTRPFSATPEMANGSVSPLDPVYQWTLSGAGWSFDAPSTGASAEIVAGPGAGTGTLSVSAEATAGNLTFDAPAVTVNLTRVVTAVENGSLARTVVDVDETDPVSVRAQGALGYSYRAEVDPGLGRANESGNCTTAPLSASTVEVDCSATVTYPAPGTARLSLEVTNGYSTATWSSPSVTVDPASALRVTPARPVGYPATSLTVGLAAANGTGDPPYGLACFDPGPAPPVCSRSAGPEWVFHATYAAAGNYSAAAWVVDSAGANRSVAVPVTIVDPLSLGPLSVPPAPAEAGLAYDLSAAVHGGALPAEAWWNASDLAAPVRVGPVGVDGVLSVPFVPPAAGPVTVSLTVRDALGETENASLALVVDPGPVASVTALTPASLPPTAVGQPVALAWRAWDALGEPVSAVTAPVDLVIENATGSPAPAWADVASLGELSGSPVGSFVVPPSAWNRGTLYLNLTPAVAGLLAVRLAGGGLEGSPVTLRVAPPDLLHLHLFAPEFAREGNRVNRTFWHVSDRSGGAVPGAYLTLQYEGPDGTTNTLLPIGWVAPGTTGLWVNYSYPSSPDGTVRLLDPAGDVLVGPVSLAPGPGGGPSLVGLPLPFVALPIAVVTGLAGASFVGRRRARELRVVFPTEEEEARRFAEGRAEVVEVVRSAGTADLATIAALWGEGPPPEDLDDWVQSLVADGTLTAAPGAEGSPGYSLAPSLPEPANPRVTIDPEALERAVAARNAVVDDDPPPAGPD